MTSEPLLSICIPTFNRAPLLEQALRSIVRVASDKLEIVVSDNASEDNTDEVVASLSSEFPIRYFRSDSNIGPDRNYLAAVSHATGRFCWLFGSDDVIVADSIAGLLEVLERNPDVTGLTMPYHMYDRQLVEWLAVAESSRTYPELETRFESAASTFLSVGETFGYLTAHIFQRSAWNEALTKFPPDEFLTGYVHVYVFGRMLEMHSFWMHVNLPLVGYRSGNDSFLAAGEIRRLELDVYGYREIVFAIFGPQSDVTNQFLRKICRTHIFWRMWSFHCSMDRRQMFSVLPMLFRIYGRYPEFYTKLLPFFVTPRWISLPLHRLVRQLRRGKRNQAPKSSEDQPPAACP